MLFDNFEGYVFAYTNSKKKKVESKSYQLVSICIVFNVFHCFDVFNINELDARYKSLVTMKTTENYFNYPSNIFDRTNE